MEYGCNTANRFGIASDDDDFSDPQQLVAAIAKMEVEKAAALKKEKTAAAKAAQQPAKAAKPTPASSSKDTVPKADRGGRGRGRGRGSSDRPPRDAADIGERFGESSGRGRGGPRGGRPFRGRGGGSLNNSKDETKDSSFEAKDSSFEDKGLSTGTQGHRGGRGFRGGRGGGRGRQFDRKSGSEVTGVHAVEKKGGHGKGNWGDDKDELVGETEPQTEQPEPREKTDEEKKYESDLAEFNKMKTLKEYRAEQKGEASDFKIRKAGEGASEAFGKLVPIQRTVIDENEEEVIVLRKDSNKKLINVDIRFADPSRGRDREGGRGRGGARGGRGGRGRSSPVAESSIDTAKEDFPALGQK